jgi:Na+-translocating ferredoxin:NAD+ oxidoreductase RnfC subunit
LGWAEITHPFHPRRGQRFQILKARQVSGIQTLVLRGTSGGTFAINQEWTDQAKPSSNSSLHIGDGVLNAQSLLALVELVANLSPKKERVDK